MVQLISLTINIFVFAQSLSNIIMLMKTVIVPSLARSLGRFIRHEWWSHGLDTSRVADQGKRALVQLGIFVKP